MSNEQITGWLNAYANGWVSYDREHVQELRSALRAALETADGVTADENQLELTEARQ